MIYLFMLIFVIFLQLLASYCYNFAKILQEEYEYRLVEVQRWKVITTKYTSFMFEWKYEETIKEKNKTYNKMKNYHFYSIVCHCTSIALSINTIIAVILC